MSKNNGKTELEGVLTPETKPLNSQSDDRKMTRGNSELEDEVSFEKTTLNFNDSEAANPSLNNPAQAESYQTGNIFCNIFQFLIHCQLFPDNDDGVPPFCRHRLCPLDHRNAVLNANRYAKKLGPFGLEYFDKRRKLFLGLASLFTIIAMALTIWGCCALSSAREAVRRTYWAGGTGHNSTSGKDFTMYVGLTSLEYVECEFVHSYDKYSSSCQQHSIAFWDPSCQTGPVSSSCSACASVATTMWTTAFFNCAGMILALMGAQTRMRVIADVPVQKLLGMYTDVWTAFSLAVALFTFQDRCFYNLHHTFNVPGVSASFWIGKLI